MDRNRYFARYHFDSDTKLREIDAMKADLKDIDGLRVAFNADTGDLHLELGETSTLEEAPTGTHDYAHGFLLCSRMLTVRYVVGNKNLWWEERTYRNNQWEPTGKHVQVDHNGHSMQRKGEEDDNGS